jgi:hypothetical protein
MRKQLIDSNSTPAPSSPSPSTELEIRAIATAWISSEAPDHPIENAFDGDRGPGGSYWLATQPGEQQLILEFDQPQTFGKIIIEVEELTVSRSQELRIAISQDQGQSYQEIHRQDYNFSPPGTTFEREAWQVQAEQVTHVRLDIKPDKGDRSCFASLTALVLQ